MNFLKLSSLLLDAANAIEYPHKTATGQRLDLIQDLRAISNDLGLESYGLVQHDLKHGEVIGLMNGNVVQWDKNKKRLSDTGMKPGEFDATKLTAAERKRIGYF